jgi:hypothetical protein
VTLRGRMRLRTRAPCARARVCACERPATARTPDQPHAPPHRFRAPFDAGAVCT